MSRLANLFIGIKEQFIRTPLPFILGVTLLVRIIYLLLDYPLWWDSHIYLGMGKYLFSGGNIGIWEPFRPLIHPLILGFLWKIGTNTILIGKILDLIFSTLTIYLVYKIGEKVFNKNTAIFASLIFSLTPLFIMFTGLVLTEPLSLFLGVLGLYFFFREYQENSKTEISLPKNSSLYLSGLFIGLSFLTKFPMGLLFATILIITFIYQKGWKKITAPLIIIGGFFTVVIPYLLFNWYLYHNPFLPFISGTWIMTTGTWKYGTGIWFYFTEFFFNNLAHLFSFGLLGKSTALNNPLSNLLYLFIFPAVYWFWKRKEYLNYRKSTLWLASLLFFLYFCYLPRKELRYLIFALPLLSLLTGEVLNIIYHQLKQQKIKTIKPTSFLVIFTIILLLPLPFPLDIERQPTFEKEINQVILKYQINGTVLSSDPAFISFLNLPIKTLDGMEFSPKIYQQQKEKYQLLFINECDLLCPPQNQTCEQEKKDFLKMVYFDNEVEYQMKTNNCTYTILLPKQTDLAKIS